MKFFVAFAAFVAVASALPMLNPVPTTVLGELQAIVAAIQNPETEPITAGLLAHLLAQIIAAKPEPVEIGPAFIEEPIPVKPEPVQPSPVVVGPIAPGAPTPLVQIIVNVNSPDDYSFPRPEPIFDEPMSDDYSFPRPEPIFDEPIFEPVDPVIVVDRPPVPVEPVHVVNPVIPEPAVNLPIDLN